MSRQKIIHKHSCYRKATNDEYAQMIQTMMGKTESGVQRLFMQMVNSIKDNVTLEQLASLLAQNNTDGAMKLLNNYIQRFANGVVSFMPVTAAATAGFLDGALRVGLGFNPTIQNAVNMMQNNQMRLINNFTEQQRQVTRLALADGIAAGDNPLQMARNFVDSVGLTADQYSAVQSYRAALENQSASALTRQLRDARFDPSVLANATGDRVLTDDQIDNIVNRYTERYVQYRANTIARTEALRSVHQSADAMIQQAIDSGNVQQEQLIQTWLTAGDGKVRDSHSDMDGQQQTYGTPFQSGLGNMLSYPGDPSAPAEDVVNCRCTLTLQLNLN